MIGSTFNPTTVSAFDKSKMTFDAQGVSATITAGQTANIDYTLTDDMFLTGSWFVTNNGYFGDTVIFQVIDPTGFTGYPAGTVLNQFITNWFPIPSTDIDLDMSYPAKILGGMLLRVIYKSTGTMDVFVGVNYKLHKILI